MGEMNRLWTAFLESLYPKICLLCQKEGEWLCQECLKDKIKFLRSNNCPYCGKLNDGQVCLSCQKDHPYLNGLIAAAYLDQNLKRVIYKYKYYRARDVSKLLAKLLKNKLIRNENIEKNKLTLAAIPLHPLDRTKRGFNQAELIAKQLAKDKKFNYQPTLLKKIRRTKDQTKLTKEQRKKNIRNVFEINEKPTTKTIILIDDIFTTGATIEEASRTIKKTYPETKVWGGVVGRR